MSTMFAEAMNKAITLTAALPSEVSIIPKAVTETRHIGYDDLPWVQFSGDSSAQLLHVDLHQGLWIVRARFNPGVTLTPHYHSGPVYGVTLKGSWYYAETPNEVNRPGSYIFEPAGSIHTLVVPEQDEVVEAWFAMHGCNVDFDPDTKEILGIVSAATFLEVYRSALRDAGIDESGVIVVGEGV